MTVGTTLSHTELSYTGVETTFPAGYSAQEATDVTVSYLDPNNNLTVLTPGINVTVSLDPTTGDVTVQAVAGGMPTATPGTVIIDRLTPGLQQTVFADLASYAASVHQQLHDAAALRDDELLYRVNRAILLPTNEVVSVPLPPKATRAGMLLGFDANGQPAVYASTAPAGYVLMQQSALTGLLQLNPKKATASPVAVGTADLLWLIAVNGATINLPAVNTRNGLPLRIVDVTGAATANPHSIVPHGTDPIDGVNAAWPLAADDGAVMLTPNANDGTATEWIVI